MYRLRMMNIPCQKGLMNEKIAVTDPWHLVLTVAVCLSWSMEAIGPQQGFLPG